MYKLIPQFRENCVIQGDKEKLSEFNIGDTIFLIANTPMKKYSTISKIEGIEFTNESKIFVDKRNLGNFGENDEVFILKYNPAEAIEIHIDISDEFSIVSKGDWTSSIKPSLIDKLIDVGQEVSFLIPWEGGAPIVGSGIIDSTLPNPPVFIGDKTTIYIDKLSNKALSTIKKKKIMRHEDRVDILEQQIKQNIIQLIRQIKHQNYPNKGQKYEFQATNPKQLFSSILNIFKDLDVIERPIEEVFDDKEQDYLSSSVFLNKENPNSLVLIDIQVIANGNSGTLILWITGENDKIISESLKTYHKRILQLKQGLEQKAEVITATCPECGGDLPIKNIDVNGIVECLYCNKISKIPKALRY